MPNERDPAGTTHQAIVFGRKVRELAQRRLSAGHPGSTVTVHATCCRRSSDGSSAQMRVVHGVA